MEHMRTMAARPVERTGPPGATAYPSRRTWPWVLVSMSIVGLVLSLLFLRNHRYFYIDDRQADGVGKLVELGRILLSGEWPWLSTNVVNSGGYVVEYQNGVFNPANLALGVVMSRLDDAALASFVQILAHTLLLAGAAAWLGRLLGLRPGWTVAFAVSIGLQPYTIYWLAGWYQVVTAFSWFVLAAAAAFALHLRPRRRYGWTLLVATYCCYTSGWPLALPVLSLVVLALAVARFVTRQPARLTWWFIAWHAGGVLASLVALYPLLLSLQLATRTSAVGNASNFLVVPLEGLVHFADPTYWPWFNSFGGYGLQRYPHLYVAWFVLPVLIFWRRGHLDQRTRALWITSLLLLATTVLGTLGPEQMLVFRFPLRFAQYSGFFLLVVTALLAAHGRPTFTRRRFWVLLAVCGVLLLTSLQSDPAGLRRILLLGLVTMALCAATWWMGLRTQGMSPGPGAVPQGPFPGGRAPPPGVGVAAFGGGRSGRRRHGPRPDLAGVRQPDRQGAGLGFSQRPQDRSPAKPAGLNAVLRQLPAPGGAGATALPVDAGAGQAVLRGVPPLLHGADGGGPRGQRVQPDRVPAVPRALPDGRPGQLRGHRRAGVHRSGPGDWAELAGDAAGRPSDLPAGAAGRAADPAPGREVDPRRPGPAHGDLPTPGIPVARAGLLRLRRHSGRHGAGVPAAALD